MSGCGGTGKSHVTNLVADYLKRAYSSEDMEHPSAVVAASTGTAASKVSGTTLHSAFYLPIFEARSKQTLSDKEVHSLRIKYKNLKVLINDELSMTCYEDFFNVFHTLCKILKSSCGLWGLFYSFRWRFLSIASCVW